MSNISKKIKYVIMIMGTLIAFTFNSIFKKKQKKLDTIAIFFMGKLGDMVCATPVFRAIKNKYPKTKIIVVGDKINKLLLEGSTDVDEYIIYTNVKELTSKIMERKISAGIMLTPKTEGLAIFIRAGVNKIIAPIVVGGFSPTETKSYKILRNFAQCVVKHDMNKYAPREYLRLLEPIGIETDDTKKYLVHSQGAEIFTSEIFQKYSKPVVGIIITAGNKIKEWPLEKFADLILKIKNKYNLEVVLIGGPNDKEYSEKLNSMLPSSMVEDFVGKLSIDQLKAFISKLSLVIGVDTGPIYIAEAYEVPTIDMVGPVAEYVQPPIGPLHKVVLPPYDRKPQLFIMNARVYDKEEAIRQTNSILVEDVMKKIDELNIFE